MCLLLLLEDTAKRVNKSVCDVLNICFYWWENISWGKRLLELMKFAVLILFLFSIYLIKIGKNSTFSWIKEKNEDHGKNKQVHNIEKFGGSGGAWSRILDCNFMQMSRKFHWYQPLKMKIEFWTNSTKLNSQESRRFEVIHLWIHFLINLKNKIYIIFKKKSKKYWNDTELPFDLTYSFFQINEKSYSGIDRKFQLEELKNHCKREFHFTNLEKI